MFNTSLCDTNIATINTIEKCKNKIEIEERKINDIKLNIEVYTDYMLKYIRKLDRIVSERVLYLLFINFTKEEKDEKFKDYYRFLNDIIVESIIGDTKCDFKKTKIITKIICCGYNSYAYDIHFVVNKTEFIFTIPILEHITVEDLVYADYGMYSISYQSSECSWTRIKASYDLEDLKKEFKNFIKGGENN